MKHITILIPDGQVNMGTIATIVGVQEIFTEANSYWGKNRKSADYKIQTAGASKKVSFSKGMITLEPEVNVSGIKRTDLIIIPPSGIRSDADVQKGNRTIIHWIEKQYKLGAEVASMCSGAFMLAASGILNGKTCSTHWVHAKTFRNAFPDVNLKEDKLITDEQGIYTNGGAYSFLNLMIYLVEKYYDRPTAIFCAKVFQIEMDRNSQSAFTIFTGQKSHNDETIKKAQAYLEKNLHEKISFEQLSSRLSVGRRNFDRRFIKATGNTPVEYLQRVKIESAKKALETSRKTINEVMYEVGYSDIKAFREVFRKITGLSPLEYKSKFNKDAAVS